MKVYRRTMLNGMLTIEFAGVCSVELPARPHLVVQVGEEIVEVYRFQLHYGVPVVMLDPGQGTEHLPGFMSAAECAGAFHAHNAGNHAA